MILVPDGSLPSQQSLKFESLATDRDPFSSSVTLRVANHTLACPTAIRYLPDPQFSAFHATPAPDHLLLTIILVSKDMHRLKPMPGCTVCVM